MRGGASAALWAGDAPRLDRRQTFAKLARLIAMLKVILPDGSEKFYEKRVSPLDVASEIGAGLAKATVAADPMRLNSARST